MAKDRAEIQSGLEERTDEEAASIVRAVARFAVPVLAVWSLFVWGNRVRNILADGEGIALGWIFGADTDVIDNPTPDAERTLSLALAAVFVILAFWVIESAFRLWRDGASDPVTCVTSAALALSIVNLVVWPIRAYRILGGDWSSGFKAVHVVLAVVSVLLGLLVLFHRYGRAGNRRSVRNSQSVADPV